MKRVGLFSLAVACMLVAWVVTGRFTWQAGLAGFLYLCAGYIIYEMVDDSRVRGAKKSLRKLSSSLYHLTPEQRHEQIRLIVEDEAVTLHFGEPTDQEIGYDTSTWRGDQDGA